MAKLKNIIKQLSEKDYKEIYDSLMESNAEKSAYVLKSLRERQLSDSKIMVELEVNANAYYTLRSRLNQKIEEHLLRLGAPAATFSELDARRAPEPLYYIDACEDSCVETKNAGS